MIISNKLFSLVLGIDNIIIQEIDDKLINEISYIVDYRPNIKYINIDTFGRLCKEWCLNQNYRIHILYIKHMDNTLVSLTLRYGIDSEYKKSFDYNSSKNKEDTNFELEAIIKATEWIAKEKGLI